MAEPLEIHVAGSGIGESIVLRLPNGKWGVVDSYVPSLADPTSSPSFRFLRERNVTTLEFLCLTHPDADHVRGMSLFLENLSVGQFWIFGATSPSDLYQRIAALLKLKAASLNDSARPMEEADDFVTTIRVAKRLRKEGKIGYVPISLGLPLYNIPASATSKSFRITALGPAGNLIEEYERSLDACFDKNDRLCVLVEQLPKVNNNKVSAGLLIEYGDTVVVLGGDIICEGWEEVLKYGASVLQLESNLVKASHHGSTNGYCTRLWEDYLSPAKSAIGVITAYSRKGLPRKEGVDHIKNNTQSLYTTSKTAIRFSKPVTPTRRRSPFRKLSPAAVSALEATFSAARLQPKSPQGICTFTFDDAGRCAHYLSGDAAEL